MILRTGVWFLCPTQHCVHMIWSISHLIKQAKLGIVLFRVFTAGVWMFFHQENIPLFTLRPNNTSQPLWSSIKHMTGTQESSDFKWLTMVLTILLGHVSLPGLWRVVMYSQYLSMKGMMSFTREQITETPLKAHIKHLALHSLNYSRKRTLSLENIVLGCSSWVLDLHVRFPKAVRHISFRSVDKTIKQWRPWARGGSRCWMQYRSLIANIHFLKVIFILFSNFRIFDNDYIYYYYQ